MFILFLIIISLALFAYIKFKDSFQIQSKNNGSTLNNEFSKVIDELLDERCVILDTETTGLNNTAEIIEICLIDSHGNILLNTLIKPKRKIRADNKAVAIHGITNDLLENAPKWDQIHNQFCSLIDGKRVVVYNALYDIRLLQQTADKYNLDIPDFKPECAMMIYGAWEGTPNQYGKGFKYHKLEAAANNLGVDVVGKPHRALTDCLTTLEVLKALKVTPRKVR